MPGGIADPGGESKPRGAAIGTAALDKANDRAIFLE
jgi:hypothetical protein